MEALRVIVSFTLVCEKEKIDNRIQKRDNSFFIINTFFSPDSSGNPTLLGVD
jgi:hypothetical protein